jgi:hypothetical protein
MVLHPRFNRFFGVAFFLTPIALGTVALGQTGLLGAAGVFFLAQRALSNEQRGNRRHYWLSRENLLLSIILLALASKPPLAVVAGVGLLATAKYRPVILAMGLVGVTSLALTPILGSGWPGDYLALIASYDLEGASSAFSWSLHPEHMSNLRSFLSVDLGVGDGFASKISNAGWALASVAVLLAGGRSRIRPSEAWALSVLAYLLFCSHVSSTDEVLLATVPAFIFPAIGSPSSVRKLVFWTLPVLGLLLSPALGLVSGTRPSPLWLTEMAMAGWILMIIYGRERVTDGSPWRADSQGKD